jgi:hypothetical protein
MIRKSTPWMLRHILVILICIPILICAPGIATPEHLKQTTLPPIVLSYTDLDHILVNVKSQLVSANKATKDNGRPSAKATIEAGEESITLPDWESLLSVKSAPNPGRAFRFVFTQSDSSVSRVEIALSDAYRQLIVEGADAAQVNAIYSYLKDAFDDFRVSIGGYSFRSVIGLLAGSLGGSLIIQPFLHPLIMRVLEPSRTVVYPGKGSLFSILCGVSVLLIVFMLPWGDWFTGFAVYTGSTSFIDRNINWMSFLGLVVTALIGTITFLGRAIKMAYGSRSAQANSSVQPPSENR